MRSLYFLSVLFLQLFTVFAGNIRGFDNSNGHRGLEDYYAADDGANAADDGAVDDAVNAAVDDDAIYDYYPHNSTIQDYVINRAQDNYQTTPSEWTNEEWGFFAAAMFLFGVISSLGCLLFVLPCCCPRSTKTAYARCLAPHLEEDTRRVNLIRK